MLNVKNQNPKTYYFLFIQDKEIKLVDIGYFYSLIKTSLYAF